MHDNMVGIKRVSSGYLDRLVDFIKYHCKMILDHPALQVTASARQVNAPDLPVPSPTPLSCQTHQ